MLSDLRVPNREEPGSEKVKCFGGPHGSEHGFKGRKEWEQAFLVIRPQFFDAPLTAFGEQGLVGLENAGYLLEVCRVKLLVKSIKVLVPRLEQNCQRLRQSDRDFVSEGKADEHSRRSVEHVSRFPLLIGFACCLHVGGRYGMVGRRHCSLPLARVTSAGGFGPTCAASKSSRQRRNV